MSFRREGFVPRTLLAVAICLLFLFKGWAYVALLKGGTPGTAAAESAGGEHAGKAAPGEVRAEITPLASSGSPGGQECRQTLERLIAEVREEKERLGQRAADLDARETSLQVYEQEVEERLASLTRLRGEISQAHEEAEKKEQDEEQKLVKMFQSMEPEDAALRLESMTDAAAGRILMRMNPRNAGQILGTMSPEKASRLGTPSEPRKQSRAAPPPPAPAAPAREVKPAAAAPKAGSGAAADRKAPAGSKLLQVAAFQTPDKADEVVQLLKDKGYPCFRSETPTHPDSPKVAYRVFVGPVSGQEIYRLKADLEKKENYRGILIRPYLQKG